MKNKMSWPNFHHLLYFWMVAQHGTISQAAKELLLTPQTISSQLRDLEKSLGEELFIRAGQRLSLTERGELVYTYADEIFGLGRELMETLRAGHTRQLNLRVGISIAVPKAITHHLLEPAFELERSVRLVCHEAENQTLFSELILHSVDVLLTDTPVPNTIKAQAFNHLLGECGVSFLCTESLAKKYRKGFPESLNHAPFLLPIEGTTLRASLDRWLRNLNIQPEVVGEFDDSGIMKAFGKGGRGIFVVPQVIEAEVCRQFNVRALGRVDEIIMRYYAISVERKVRHPAVIAICEQARTGLFAET
ncbi:MAG: transcriptional activator NhaR [Planctomycetota bacterium]|nr:transcriptional activator NhaR [Planctomycetota bacterium]